MFMPHRIWLLNSSSDELLSSRAVVDAKLDAVSSPVVILLVRTGDACGASVWRSDRGLVCSFGVEWRAARQRECCCDLRCAERELCWCEQCREQRGDECECVWAGYGVGGLSAVGGVGGSACGVSVWRSDIGLLLFLEASAVRLFWHLRVRIRAV
jgi:hypothetical protein